MRRVPETLCADCGVDVTPCTGRRGCRHIGRFEWFGVTDKVWAAAGAPSETMDFFLCVGCLEERLGRRLVPVDFPDFSINDDDPWNSARLVDRKGTGRDGGRRFAVALVLVLDFGCELAAAAALLRLDPGFLREHVEFLRKQAELRDAYPAEAVPGSATGAVSALLALPQLDELES